MTSRPHAVTRPALALLLLVTAASVAGAQTMTARRALTPHDLWSMARVSSPAISPDGNRVAYTVTRYDLETWRADSDIWVVPISGGTPVQMTNAPGSDASPAWSPDGRWIAFVSSRGGNGPQIYLLPSAGGEARPLTNQPGGAVGPVWSKDGKQLLYTSDVWPDGDPMADRLKALEEGPTQAKIYDELMYRHWDTWEDGMRSHVFLVDVTTGDSRDLTPGPYDTPPIALGGFQDYALSPDGSELAFVRNTDVPTAVGTGNDIWLVPARGGEPTLLTKSDANDTSPGYSPDGRYIAYLGMERPGFEADRTRLMIYDRTDGSHRALTGSLDRSVDAFDWMPGSDGLYFLCQDGLYHSVYRVMVSSGDIDQITTGHYDGQLAVGPAGRRLVVARQSHTLPTELFLLDEKGTAVRQLTDTNRALLDQLDLTPIEPFTFAGAGGTPVEGFLVRPPGFDPAKKYPLVFLVHGGPQGAWSDNFHYRWNAEMFAAPGYIAVAINPRGSTGYGQKFTDQITRDWGGKVYTDLMNGLDYVLKTYPFIDPARMAAAGASYGGYMMNWMEGHTDRFKAIVNHDGVSEPRSMYGATEELWFPEWEFGGTPWENPSLYEKWNPILSAKSFKTPMLIIHGGRDYRVPLEQGLIMFTALRRQGVPARLLYFPDENHWVLKPQNGLLWWDTVYDWLARWLR